MPQPNIIFVFADQMRASSLGCAGQEQVLTPNLDAFAGQGIRLTRAIANTPVCCPARASIITGLHTLTHQLVYNDVQLRTDVTSIAHALNRAGYRCGYIGKWHMDCADRAIAIPPGPRRQGFDDYWAAANCHHRYFQGYYYADNGETPVWIDGYEPQGQTDMAIEYLRDRARDDRPFCLFLSWGPPHCPYQEAPEEYLALYPAEDIPLRPNAPAHTDREVVAGYYAHITALDACFGRLLQAIAAAGIEENTLVIFTSDHGDMLYSHDRGWKCKPWLESVNIPFLARWPGHIPANHVSDGLLSLVDVMPTVLGLAGVAIPAEVEGENLSALLRGDDSASPESVFINIPVTPTTFSFREWRGVVTKRNTYATFRDRPWVLYDDIADPYQLRNLADSPDHAPLREQLHREVLQWLARTKDPFESSFEVAEKYYPGHVGCNVPVYENEAFTKARKARFAHAPHPVS